MGLLYAFFQVHLPLGTTMFVPLFALFVKQLHAQKMSYYLLFMILI